jgi:hypothetical protein
LASEFATLGIRGSIVGVAGALAESTGFGGGGVAQAFNAIVANAANDQARNPADRFLVVFNLAPFFKSTGCRVGHQRTSVLGSLTILSGHASAIP